MGRERNGQNPVCLFDWLAFPILVLTVGIPRVLAHVDATMVKPQPERPFEGIITIHSELSPMASSEYEALGRYAFFDTIQELPC